MRLIILLIAALLVGYGALMINIIDSENYVKLYFNGNVIEVKLLVFLLLLVPAVLLCYFIFKLVKNILQSPALFGKWRTRRNRETAGAQLGAGYLSLIKGDWRKAETQLLKKSDYSAIPYVNYLGAAKAAQEQGRWAKRDEYLKLAYTTAPKERLAIGLTKAQLHQQSGQWEQARATLDDIASDGHSNAQYIAMMLQSCQQAGDWEQVKTLLPQAKKHNALPAEMLDDLHQQVCRASLQHSADIKVAWKALPRDQKQQLDNIAVYVQSLVQQEDYTGAEKLIRNTLKSEHSDELVHIYGGLKSTKPAKLLRRVEGWLMARPENAELNLAAGRLALNANRKDQAKKYLQSAISLAQLPLAYKLLGEVFEADDDRASALQLYRSGLQASSDDEHPALAVTQELSPSTQDDASDKPVTDQTS